MLSVYIDSIDEKVASDWNHILITKVEDVIPSVFSKGKRQVTAIIDGETTSARSRTLIDLSLPFFQKAGLVVNPRRGYIDYISHYYDSKARTHYDDYYSANDTYSCVHECVIILQKDERLQGGDLHVYEEDPRSFLKMIGVENASRQEMETVTGMVIVSPGDLIHEITSCSSRGTFNYVVITLYEE